MTAITAPVAIVLAAVAVDSGSLYVEKRRAQSLADLAAITAAANLGKATAAATTAMSDNGVKIHDGGDRIVVVTGRYRDDPRLAAEDRFLPGAAPANAAKVTYRTTGTRYFAGALIPPPEISASGLATASAAAAFSVGSRLLSLDDELINTLLGGLTGSNISLTVMDYNALLAADVSLLSFLDALAVELNLTAGSYAQALDAEVTLGQVARALSRSQGLNGGAQAAAGRLASQAGARKLRLSDLIDLGDEPILQATIRQVAAEVNVLELLSLGAMVAGQGRQVSLTLPATVPGILAVSVELAIGEPPQRSPWLRIGDGGELVRTAQTRLALTVEIAGIGGLLGARIRIPLYLELAYAEAKLNGITCPSGRPESMKVSIDARPGIANLYLADVDRSKLGGFASPVPRSPARLIQLPLVSVTGQAQAEISNVSYKTLTFTHGDIVSGKIRKVTTQDYVQSLTRSLFSSLRLDVRIELGPLGIPLISLPSNSLALLGDAIAAAAGPIDKVLYTLLSTLGLSLGQADIRVNGATCGRAVLVQ